MELYEKYKTRINDSNPGKVLAQFYCELFNIPLSPNIIIMFNKLLKEFSAETLFNAVSATFSMDTVNHTNVYALIKHIAKALLEKTEIQRPKKLETSEIKKQIEKAGKRKLKIGSPFNEL